MQNHSKVCFLSVLWAARIFVSLQTALMKKRLLKALLLSLKAASPIDLLAKFYGTDFFCAVFFYLPAF